MSIEKTITQPSFLELMTQNMPLWFQQGGVVMWLLLLISFFSTMVTLERVFVWAFYYSQKERFAIQECFSALNKQKKTEALLACKKVETPALNMLEFGIKALPFSPKEKMESYAENQISLLSRGQSILDTIITMAPMLGILGTILGIIESFNILSAQGVDNPTAVVGGIAQALITTAAGLAVALMALLPYNFFRSHIQKLILHLETIGSEFNHICQQKSLITNQLSDIAQKQEKAENETVSKQKKMPYHYEFSEETGEVNVSIHPNGESIKRTTPSAIAEMYNQALPSIYKHIKLETKKTNKENENSSSESGLEKSTDEIK
ncbi:MotA/TolQ/ExbB proton channel family protein [Psychromonas sp.]|nr:MotA/TolQ/ExbB proton channel family protein [Psychromonas sp.]